MNVEIAIVKKGLVKFKFKRFSVITDEKQLDELAKLWLETLVRENVTTDEYAQAVLWLCDNKPEWPDVADLVKVVNRNRAAKYAALMVDGIGVTGPDGRLSIVPKDSPAGLAELARLESEKDKPLALEVTKPNFVASAERLLEKAILTEEETDEARRKQIAQLGVSA